MKTNPLVIGAAAALLLAVFAPAPWLALGLGPWLDCICLPIVFGIVCFGCVKWLQNNHSKRSSPYGESEPTSPDVAILRQRYARSEIDREQYLEHCCRKDNWRMPSKP